MRDNSTSFSHLTFQVHYVLVPFMTLSHPNADAANCNEPTGHDAPAGKVAFDGDAAREARRERRLNHLEILRNIGMEMAAALGHATMGRTEYNIQAFAKTHDPALAYTRITLAIRRIVALEDRLDEDARTRAARIAEEQAEETRKAARESLNAEKRIVRRAVREAVREADADLDRDRREKLLDDLFSDYDDYNHGTLAQVVAGICTDLGIVPDMTLWEHAPKEGEQPDPVKLKALTLEMAEEYLAEAMQTAPPPATSPPVAQPAAATPANERGRGPPDG
jgi:hypothetical protein